MVELTIEQKAQRYDEALERAKKAQQYDDCNVCPYIFPELAESEDEKIRKGLIDYFSDFHLQTFAGLDPKKIQAWLEKQGEPTDILADAILDSNKDGLIADTIRHKKELVTCPICGTKIEKQSAHKSAFWSEEDEERYLSCLKRLGTGNIEQPETVNTVWLKSLKDRIQPQQEWSEEDETNRDLLYNALNKVYDIDYNVDLSNWINKRILLNLKQEWSEEDKMQLDAAIHLVSSTGHIETANWLKSIKDRVLQQNITVTDEELANAKKDAYNDALDKIEYHSGEPTFDDGWSAAIWYLKKKNARPQLTWKPSDKQFKLLKHIMENVPLSYIDKSEVGGLYLDLKRLIGE